MDQPTLNPQPPPNHHLTPVQKGILVFGVIAIVILLASYIYAMYLSRLNYNKVAEEARKAGQFERTNRVSGDWQTYRNEEYGFEVKYPHDVQLATCLFNFSKPETNVYLITEKELSKLGRKSADSVCDGVRSEQYDGTGALHIMLGEPHLRDYMCNIGYKNWKMDITVNEILLDKEPAMSCDTPSLLGYLDEKGGVVSYKEHVVLMNKEDQGLAFTYLYREDDPETRLLSDQILSTFRFIK